MPGLELPMKLLFLAGGRALWYDLQLQDHKLFCLRNLYHAPHGELKQRLRNYWYAALSYQVTECYKFYLDQTQAQFNNLSSQMAFKILCIHIGDLHQLWKERPYLTHREVSAAQADCMIYNLPEQCPLTSLKSIWHSRVSMYWFSTVHPAAMLRLLWPKNWTYHLIESWIT